MSAHTYTRGTWTTPEAVHPDRDVGGTDYVAAGVMTAPTYLKWALLYEEPDNRTLWVAKALPRDWLALGSGPGGGPGGGARAGAGAGVVVEKATTRYGRVSYRLQPTQDPTTKAYTIRANLTLSATFAVRAPAGGVRLRLRAPLPYAGKLKSVTVGGEAWAAIDAAAETVDFAAAKLTAELITSGLPDIVATFELGAGSQ